MSGRFTLGSRSSKGAVIRDFLIGAGSVFQLLPVASPYADPYEADAEALRGDMDAVGRDLMAVIAYEKARRQRSQRHG